MKVRKSLYSRHPHDIPNCVPHAFHIMRRDWLAELVEIFNSAIDHLKFDNLYTLVDFELSIHKANKLHLYKTPLKINCHKMLMANINMCL